jgi:tRNA(Ile)-lysidine synthetase-like protein
MDGSVASALDAIPDGRWGVAVSGGADSTALLVLLRERRPTLPLVVLHFNHQLRGDESDDDERFVVALTRSLDLPCVVRRADESRDPAEVVTGNRQQAYRLRRLGFFRDAVREHMLAGVLLAHHADDNAETVLLRLARGSGVLGLRGMSKDSRVSGVRLLRPLLDVAGEALRDELRARSLTWREDSSNQQLGYARNRARVVLRESAGLRDALLELARAARALTNWLRATTPTLPERFRVAELADLSDLQARFAARCWLMARGATPRKLNDDLCDRLVEMARDASSPATWMFPNLTVSRRAGRIAPG